MTREEAINVIKEHIDTYITCHGEEDTVAVSLDNVDIEAFDMAIKVLEQEQSDDAISRQAVLDILKDKWNMFSNANDAMQESIDTIEAIPSVTPEQKTGRWIDDKCSVCGKGIEDLISSSEWYINEEPNFCPFCGCKMQEMKDAGDERGMNIHSTREKFENLDYFMPIGEFNGVVIIPTNELHYSGFGCMKFALTNGNEVVGCVGGGSDVIHLNGIGGYGKDLDKVIKTNLTKRIDWSIDCLPNGLIRLFCSHKLDIDELILSDFNLYVK